MAYLLHTAHERDLHLSTARTDFGGTSIDLPNASNACAKQQPRYPKSEDYTNSIDIRDGMAEQ